MMRRTRGEARAAVGRACGALEPDGPSPSMPETARRHSSSTACTSDSVKALTLSPSLWDREESEGAKRVRHSHSPRVMRGFFKKGGSYL
jgi:hypothetical protein